MKPLNTHQAGFTILELSLVMIAIGALAMVFLPLAQVSHDDGLREADTNTLETIRTAMLGYIRVHEGIPCVDAAGADISTGCDSQATLNLLGVRNIDSRRQTFAFDVNDTLTQQGIASSGTSLCTALAEIIDPANLPATPPEPNICNINNSNEGGTACIADSAMAVVIAARGSDRCLNLENAHSSAANDGICPDAVAANRTFENPARVFSRDQDDAYYEDLVYTITPAELSESLDCPTGGGSGSGSSLFSFCDSGEIYIQASYGDNSGWLGVDLDGECYAVGAGTMAALGCLEDDEEIELRSNASCGGGTYFDGDVEDLDTNNDGRADIVCNSSGCTYR